MAVEIANDQLIDDFVADMLRQHPGESTDGVVARWRVRRGIAQLPWGEESRVRARWQAANGEVGKIVPAGTRHDEATQRTDGVVTAEPPIEAPWLAEVRSWAKWNLLLGVISFPFNPAWGVVLVAAGLASWRFKDRSMLVIYGCVLGWAGMTNLFLGELGWKAFSLLQLWWAIMLFRRFHKYGQVIAANPEAFATQFDGQFDGWDARRIFPWVGIGLSATALYAFFGLGIALAIVVGSSGEEISALDQIWAVVIALVANVAALGFAVALASVLSDYDHPTLSRFALAASGLPLVLLTLALTLAVVTG